MGNIIVVVAVLLIQMDKNHDVSINPKSNLIIIVKIVKHIFKTM